MRQTSKWARPCLGMSNFMLRGSPRGVGVSHLQAARLSTLGEFEHVRASSQSSSGLAEACGGEGRASQ
eukprot:5523562-Alexandrium_andersonii.AAC.1